MAYHRGMAKVMRMLQRLGLVQGGGEEVPQPAAAPKSDPELELDPAFTSPRLAELLDAARRR